VNGQQLVTIAAGNVGFTFGLHGGVLKKQSQWRLSR